MFVRPRLLGLAALAAAFWTHLAPAAMAQGQPLEAGGLVIERPWARATPGGAKVGGGYVTITNRGSEPDRLVGGTIEAAARVEPHETTTQDGVARMRPIDGVTIRPGETVTFAPGGLHLMFTDLKRPLVAGQSLKGSLTFERAGEVPLTYSVEGIGAMAPGGGHAGGHGGAAGSEDHHHH